MNMMFIKSEFWPPHEISILFTPWDGQLFFSQTSCQEKDKRPKCAEMNATGREASGSFRCEIPQEHFDCCRRWRSVGIQNYKSIAIAACTYCTNEYEDCQWPLHELYPYFAGYEKTIALDTTSIATPFVPVSPWLGPKVVNMIEGSLELNPFYTVKTAVLTKMFTFYHRFHLSFLTPPSLIWVHFLLSYWYSVRVNHMAMFFSTQKKCDDRTPLESKTNISTRLPDLFYFYHIWSNLHQSIYSFFLRCWSLSSFPLR